VGRGAPRQLSLVRLAAEIARSLATVGRVAVEGEVYRPQTSRSGWVFFTLRDRAAQLPVACPSRHSRRCRAVNGERVLVVGTLVWLNDRGQLQLEAEEVTPVGEGAVAALIAETRARLAADGLLQRPRRAVPRLPRVIGVVCGADAAVRKDIESVVAARYPGYPVWFEETTVSGPGSAVSIVEALLRVSARADVDVVVLARGGGDATALLPWSDEELCRVVAACPVPVVSAIGHESDRPLCDEVADLRCGTPSLAAHAVVPDRAVLYSAVDALVEQAMKALVARHDRGLGRLQRCEVSGALASAVLLAQSHLGHARQLLAWSHPTAVARAAHLRLEACDWRRPFASRVLSDQRRLRAVQSHAQSLSPQRVLDRGFAVVHRASGSVLREAGDVEPGELISVTVAHGRLTATVDAVEAGREGRRDTDAGGRWAGGGSGAGGRRQGSQP